MRVEAVIKPSARKVFNDVNRFKAVVAGRRFGKSYLLAYMIFKDLISGGGRELLYLAPTYAMAKRVMWKYLIKVIPSEYIKEKIQSDLQIRLINNSVIYLGGAQNYDSYRGLGLDNAYIDEAADIPDEAWTEVLRPALSDKEGGAVVVGTPEGKNNWFWDITQDKRFNVYQFKTSDGGWVKPEEIEIAQSQMDERTYRQEYEASFLDMYGAAYYAYSDMNQTNETFNPGRKTYLCWDFNAGECPMAVCIVQESNGLLFVVKEFVFKNSNTDETCQAVNEYLIQNNFNGALEVTGDYSGKRRESSASFTDYQIIEHYFKNYKGFKIEKRPTLSVKDRVAALNALFKTYSGFMRLFVNADYCPKLVNDLKRVTWKESGVKLDGTNPELTHISDALSYFAYNYFPIQELITSRAS